MKLNTDKCRLIVLGYKHEQVWVNIGKDLIWESNDVKLLGVTIDRDLKFDKHVLKLCSKANQLSAVANLLSFNKRRKLFKAFVESQFKYFLIVWMFHSRPTNNNINRLHDYMREPLELFMMTMYQLLINYFQWTNFSVFTIKISRDS